MSRKDNPIQVRKVTIAIGFRDQSMLTAVWCEFRLPNCRLECPINTCKGMIGKWNELVILPHRENYISPLRLSQELLFIVDENLVETS